VGPRLSHAAGIISDMPDLDQIRLLPLEHGPAFTLLGQLAGATLTEYLHAPSAVPRLHLGLNTLPDPPLPIAAHVPLSIPEDRWRRCEEDLLAFLDGLVTWWSGQPPPRQSAFGPVVRTMPLLRPDSIVLAWKASMIMAADGDASVILVRELMDDGQTYVTNLDPAIVKPALAAWAVDRGGFSVFAWARTDLAGSLVSVGDEVLDPDDEVFQLLAAILAAQ
jgi:hypothetical protein